MVLQTIRRADLYGHEKAQRAVLLVEAPPVAEGSRPDYDDAIVIDY